MKIILTAIFVLCSVTNALSQEFTTTFAKYPDCKRGRGICDIRTPPEGEKSTVSNANTSFVTDDNGSTILRIYRDKLTQEEQDQLLELSIVSTTKNKMQFVMEEALPLSENIKERTAVKKLRQLKVLEAKTYPVIVTDAFIDITIVAAIDKR